MLLLYILHEQRKAQHIVERKHQEPILLRVSTADDIPDAEIQNADTVPRSATVSSKSRYNIGIVAMCGFRRSVGPSLKRTAHLLRPNLDIFTISLKLLIDKTFMFKFQCRSTLSSTCFESEAGIGSIFSAVSLHVIRCEAGVMHQRRIPASTFQLNEV